MSSGRQVPHPRTHLNVPGPFDLGDHLVANGRAQAQAAEKWFQQAVASFSKQIEYDSKTGALEPPGRANAQLRRDRPGRLCEVGRTGPNKPS